MGREAGFFLRLLIYFFVLFLVENCLLIFIIIINIQDRWTMIPKFIVWWFYFFIGSLYNSKRI